MASLRQRVVVTWEGHDDVEVLTTMRDVIASVDLVADLPDIENTNRAAAQTAIIWCALKRAGHPVPPYLEWLDLLDRWKDVPGVDPTEGPTPRALSPNGQLPSLSSPAPTGARGAKKTPARSKPRKS